MRSGLHLAIEAVAFIVASLVHFGVLLDGYEHDKMRIAEVLLLRFGVSLARPDVPRAADITAQAFALVGTLVGLFTIAIGIGPRVALDLSHQAGILRVLGWGPLWALRGDSVAWRTI